MRSAIFRSATLAVVALVLIALGATGCAQANQPAPRTAMSLPAMKMTTEIPASVTTPAEVETRLGTLRFVDGVPTEETTWGAIKGQF